MVVQQLNRGLTEIENHFIKLYIKHFDIYFANRNYSNLTRT